MRAFRIVSDLSGRTYEARLGEVGLTSLEDRMVRGNMITTFRIMTGKHKVDPGQFMVLCGSHFGHKEDGQEGEVAPICLHPWRGHEEVSRSETDT